MTNSEKIPYWEQLRDETMQSIFDDQQMTNQYKRNKSDWEELQKYIPELIRLNNDYIKKDLDFVKFCETKIEELKK